MKLRELGLEGLRLIEPRVFRDERGFFLESWALGRYAEAGIDVAFVQDNHSRSVQGTVRGLHYQRGPGQAKLVRVVAGRIFDVAVDIRPDSPTFGRWEGVWLDAEEHHQLFVPAGFAHGFCVTSELAEVLYKVSTPYEAKTEATIAWDDPELAVKWPVDAPVLSDRDRNGESFASYRSKVGK